jgi:hypothetical protein
MQLLLEVQKHEMIHHGHGVHVPILKRKGVYLIIFEVPASIDLCRRKNWRKMWTDS